MYKHYHMKQEFGLEFGFCIKWFYKHYGFMVEMQTADRVLVLQIGKEQQRSLFVDRFTAVFLAFSICFSFGRLSCPTSVLLLHTHPIPG